jgi:hypothetical protein
MTASDPVFGFDIYITVEITEAAARETLSSIYNSSEFIYWDFISDEPSNYKGKYGRPSFFHITPILDIPNPQYPFKLSVEGLNSTADKWQHAYTLCKKLAADFQLDCVIEWGNATTTTPYDCLVFTKNGKIYLGDDIEWEEHGRINISKEIEMDKLR